MSMPCFSCTSMQSNGRGAVIMFDGEGYIRAHYKGSLLSSISHSPTSLILSPRLLSSRFSQASRSAYPPT